MKVFGVVVRLDFAMHKSEPNTKHRLLVTDRYDSSFVLECMKESTFANRASVHTHPWCLYRVAGSTGRLGSIGLGCGQKR